MSDPIAAFLQQVIKQRDQWRGEDHKKWKECEEKGDFSAAQIWFRGVSDANYKLTPQVYRPSTYELKKFPLQKPADSWEVDQGS